jgi:CRISPR-associated protein Cst2
LKGDGIMVYEIGILGRIRIDAHSLNNEGTVGNVTEPRTVILADGRKTDGISGEMLKHIHVEATWQLAKERKLPLCSSCEKLDPMKADGNAEVKKQKTVNDALNKALECTICDLHGFLVQQPTLSRKSVIEFGWAIALPDEFHREIHVHSRVAPGKKTAKGQEGEEEGTIQMVYNRPTRSGIYAFVSIFQPWRIGLNEIDYKYVVDETSRKNRYCLVLDAYKAMMLRIEGAMTTTRLPHVGMYEGLIVRSDSAFPVPVLSPLVPNYIDQLESIAKRTGCKIERFASLDDLLSKLDGLKEEKVYKLERT